MINQRGNVGLDINTFKRFKVVCEKNYRSQTDQIKKWIADEEEKLGIEKEVENELTQ